MTFSLKRTSTSPDGAQYVTQWEWTLPESDDGEPFRRSHNDSSRKFRKNRGDSSGQQSSQDSASSDGEQIRYKSSKRREKGKQRRGTRDLGHSSESEDLSFVVSDEGPGLQRDERGATRQRGYRKRFQDHEQSRDHATRPRSRYYQSPGPARKRESRRNFVPSASSDKVDYVHAGPDPPSSHRRRDSRQHRASDQVRDRTNASPIHGESTFNHPGFRPYEARNAERDRKDMHQRSKRNTPPSLDGSSDGQNRKRSHVEFDRERMAYVRRSKKKY